MQNPAIRGGSKAFSGGIFRIFGSFMRIRFFWIFTLFIFINAIIIGIQAHDSQAIIDDFGKRFMTPTVQLQDESNAIIERGGLFIKELSLWNELLDLWNLFSSFWVIYLEISVMAWIIRKIVLWDDSKSSVSVLIALFFFFTIQMIYLSSKGLSIWAPWTAIGDMFRAIPYIIKPLAKIGELFNENKGNLSSIVEETIN